ncbi:hypothetical protein C8Q73DRAFT_662102 [Cubamyces lactineus]|nr:hypothetical protein C8Q73DRAFT_662102 [Cubamyces lactineus]
MSAMIHPAGKRFLMRKSSNAENLPPSAHSAGHAKKAEALVSAREASRRRRARVVSGSLVLRKIVENAHRRASKAHPRHAPVKLEIVPESLPSESETREAPAQATQPAPAPQTTGGPTLRFPRWLARPPNFPRPFDRANIDACNEQLQGVPHGYILRGLDTTGKSMWSLVQNAIFQTSGFGQKLPQELQVVIADHTMLEAATPFPNSYPTHVLALWDCPSLFTGSQNTPEPAGRRKVRIVPVHNIVMAANCANWFPMPPSTSVEYKRVFVNEGGAKGTQMNLPVVPLPVPHVDSFHQLLSCLYTHRVSHLLDELVPVPKPHFVLPTPNNPNPQNPHYIKETGRRLAARYQPWAIAGMLRHVIGLWQNACHLGISDRRLWIAIDWSWDMLLTGLAYATGHPDAVPRPEPKVFGQGSAASHQQAAPSQPSKQHFEQVQTQFSLPPQQKAV